MPRRAGMLAVMAALLVTSTAGVTPAARAADPVTLHVGMVKAQAPESINPFVSWAWYPTATTYEYLTGFDLNYQPTAGFAQSWSVAPDNVTWTFKIAPDLKWSDGTPATARDAAFTFNYLLGSVGTKSELAVGINNTGEVGQRIKSARAIDDQTFELVTTSPGQFPLQSLVFIVPEHVWKDVPTSDAVSSYQSAFPVVGTGPFVGGEYKPGQFLRLVRNPYYNRDPKPALDEIVISYYDTADAMTQALGKGDVDVIEGFPTAMVPSLQSQQDITVVSAATPWYFDLAFNTSTDGKTTSSALRDPAFRDALGYAIDTKTLVDKVLDGHGKAGVGVVPPAAPSWFSDMADIARTFDLTKAASMLDAAGYRDANGDGIREDKDGKPLELRLLVQSDETISSKTGQFIADWFGQVGVKLSTTAQDYASASATLAAPKDGGGNWDMAVWNWWPYPFPDKMLKHFTTKLIGATNQAYWSNAQFDELFTQQSATVDAAARKAIVDQMNRLVYQQAPILVLMYVDRMEAYRTDRFEGWVRQPAPDGGVFNQYVPEYSFLNLKPVGTGASAAPSTPVDAPASAAASVVPGASAAPVPASGTGSSDTPVIPIAIVVIAAVAAGVLLMRRRAA